MRILAQIRAVWRRWWKPLTLGQRGERAAARFLKKAGYILIAVSQRDKIGEIDIIAVDGRTVVFVEVKTRRLGQLDTPAEAVTREKQGKLTRLALGFLRRNELLEQPARFDVIAVSWPEDAREPQIQHLPNAFPAIGSGQMFS
ncbi:YraN family protein [Lignipirellula cremea]|uniref:UPF0102 protein Pla8534_41060 n=1 Tax=Lignipirellula cremea TaxID=2528010 RepID=A0A518DWR7_9BACT|nr:YraN family protein [Lignipirellula cremea]QDU96286.1 hypothetical protein Pla8534_41060 [Lignipirellula cremea]